MERLGRKNVYFSHECNDLKAVVESLCRGVAPETSAKALEEMKAKGITVVAGLQ